MCYTHAMKEIPLSGQHGRGHVAIVDDSDYERVMYKPNGQVRNWIRSKMGQITTQIELVDGTWKTVTMPNFVLQPPKGRNARTHDGDQRNCTRANLYFKEEYTFFRGWGEAEPNEEKSESILEKGAVASSVDELL